MPIYLEKENDMNRMTSLALALAVALTAGNALAAAKPSGHYRMGDQRFAVADGVALRLWKDDEREVYGVVLGEGPFDTKAGIGSVDPLDAIAESAPADSGAMLLTLRAGDGGALEIASLIARPDSFSTNGDGKERILVAGGRITGEWTKPETEFFDQTYEISLRFDLPITELPDPGQSLPADGGAPGKAYLAFLAAVGQGDARAVIAAQSLPEGMAELLDQDFLVEAAAMSHPTSATILGGWIDGDRAQLRISGQHSFGHTVRGRIEMKNEGGIWKVGDHSVR
jgi:hypothetical protein